MSYVAITLAATTLTFLIAAVLTYFVLYQPVNDDYRLSLVNRKADQIANYFDQKQALLQLQLATFSSAPQVTRSFQQESSDMLRVTEEILTHSIPFAEKSIDLVLSMAVLEHIQYPFIYSKEVHRILKTNGTFIGSVAFLEGFHSNSYYHHTHYGTYNTLSTSGFKDITLFPPSDTKYLYPF